MDVYVLIGLCCLYALVALSAGQSCDQSYYELCLKQLVQFADKGDLIFASSHQELKQQCVQALTAEACLTRYSRKCLSPEERTKFNTAISGPQKVTLGLCGDESALQDKYISSLPCLRNMSNGLSYCKEKFDRNQRDLISVHYEDNNFLNCCSFDGYHRCLLMLMELQGDCRESALEVVSDLAVAIGGTFSEGMCAEHFEKCLGVSSEHQHKPKPWLSLWSILVIILFSAL